ncbi:MAG: hypothetical protein HY700_20375 [Gemmatimonadetes bacterium]|nr:hypothetical protein [Gemmatimonadota bacterium]
MTRSATGDAHIIIFGGATPERFSFSALGHAGGEAHGQLELFSEQAGGVRRHGSITCITVVGDTARLGGVIDQSTDPRWLNRGALWTVVDRGEGANGAPDLTSDLLLTTPAQVAFHCASGFRMKLLPVEHGNIQVR